MAKDKTADDVKEIKAADETAAELEDVKVEAPEVDLPGEAAGAETSDEASEKALVEAEAKVTKAGKHSAKAIREAEEEETRLKAKEERAEKEEAEDEAPKAPKRQLPNPLHQHGKKYRKAAE